MEAISRKPTVITTLISVWNNISAHPQSYPLVSTSQTPLLPWNYPLQTYCFETAVTCAEAEEQSSYIRRMAIHLGQYMAIYLAETVTGLLQRVLTHPAKGLVNESNAALLTQKFWVQAIYTELLCASSRFRAVRE